MVGLLSETETVGSLPGRPLRNLFPVVIWLVADAWILQVSAAARTHRP
jgi:hypothetical protein